MHLWQKLRRAACHRKGACKAHRYISVCAHGDDISGMSQLLCRLLKSSPMPETVCRRMHFAQQIHQLPDYRAKAGDR